MVVSVPEDRHEESITTAPESNSAAGGADEIQGNGEHENNGDSASATGESASGSGSDEEMSEREEGEVDDEVGGEGDGASASGDASADSSKPKNFPCEICGKIFSKSSSLTQHHRIHSEERPFKCMLCERTFRQSGNLTKHIKSHKTAHLRWNRNTNEKPFKCTFRGCDKSFTAKSSLQNHTKTHHDGEVEEPPSERLNKVNSLDERLSAQAAAAGGAPTVIQRTLTQQELMQHAQAKNNLLLRGTLQARNNFACCHRGCGLSFPSEELLRSHILEQDPLLHAEHNFLRFGLSNLLQVLDLFGISNDPKFKQVLDVREIRTGLSIIMAQDRAGWYGNNSGVNANNLAATAPAPSQAPGSPPMGFQQHMSLPVRGMPHSNPVFPPQLSNSSNRFNPFNSAEPYNGFGGSTPSLYNLMGSSLGAQLGPNDNGILDSRVNEGFGPNANDFLMGRGNQSDQTLSHLGVKRRGNDQFGLGPPGLGPDLASREQHKFAQMSGYGPRNAAEELAALTSGLRYR